MSGIFGIIRLQGQPIPPQVTLAMQSSLHHRGGDRTDIWCNQGILLGCTQRWTTPESKNDRQPRHHPNGLVLVADARLDNRDTLLEALQPENTQCLPLTDSQILLLAAARWGMESARRLIGDFAQACLDKRSRCLYCARDIMGVRPLYYAVVKQSLVFASEIKAILASGLVPPDLNYTKIAGNLLRTPYTCTETAYAHIFRLKPGHTLRFDRHGIRLATFWSPLEIPSLPPRNNQAYPLQFRTIFSQAVACRLRRVKDCGSTLSGGLDSSSIASVARNMLQAQGEKLHTFSAIFPNLPPGARRPLDERPFMEAVLESGGFLPHFIVCDRLNPFGELEQLLELMDEPLFGPNLYLHWAMFEKARQCGVTVFLDGIDGDTTVSYGFERLPSLLLKGHWLCLLREIQAMKKVFGQRSGMRLMYQYGLRPLLRTGADHTAARLWPLALSRKLFPLQADFARSLDLGALLRRSLQPLAIGRRQHQYSFCTPAFSEILEMLDKAAATFGLEIRFPFFDQRLIEFCLGLPVDQKLQNGWSRMILRQAMATILPEKVCWRISKANLSPNFNRNLPLLGKEYIETALYASHQPIAEFADLRVLRAAYQDLQQPDSWRQGEKALQLYTATCLNQWLLINRCKSFAGDFLHCPGQDVPATRTNACKKS